MSTTTIPLVKDSQGNVLSVDSDVCVWDGRDENEQDQYLFGKIESISDPDADYDDDLQRGVTYPPKITVLFTDGIRENYNTSIANYSRGPFEDWDEIEWETDEVEANV